MLRGRLSRWSTPFPLAAPMSADSPLPPIALVLGPMRLPFLLLTPASLLPGIGAALLGGQPSFGAIALVFLGALAAHISVNAFNEWLDFRSGLDAMTCRTPFSGGSGSLPARPDLAPLALAMALISLLVCIATGLFFVARQGMALLPIGVAGVALVLGYTRLITRSPALCLIAPGLGFGPLMVLGSEIALTGQASATGVAASLPALFLVSGLLLLNQFPDVDADRAVGRRHLPIVIGLAASARVFAALVVAGFAVVALTIALRLLPPACALGLLPALIAVPMLRTVLRDATHPERLHKAMGMNVAITLLMPALVGLGLFV